MPGPVGRYIKKEDVVEDKMPKLTEKEQEVLEYLCMNFSVDEIAECLEKSKSTVLNQIFTMSIKFKGFIPCEGDKPKQKDIISYVKKLSWKRNQESSEVQTRAEITPDQALEQLEQIIGPVPVIEPENSEEISSHPARMSREQYSNILREGYLEKLKNLRIKAGHIALEGGCVDEQKKEYARLDIILKSVDEIAEVLLCPAR